MKSQSRIQCEINLHKPRKKVISASWSQNDAQMNHEQVKFTRHIIAQTWRGAITSSPIIYYMSSGGGYIKITQIQEKTTK
jgi:hypothetical protein